MHRVTVVRPEQAHCSGAAHGLSGAGTHGPADCTGVIIAAQSQPWDQGTTGRIVSANQPSKSRCHRQGHAWAKTSRPPLDI